MEKVSDLQNFILKYILKHSQTILAKKIDQNFLTLSFFTILTQKSRFRRFFVEKKIFFSKKIVLVPKSLKNVFWAKNGEKMAKSKNFGRKFFLVGIDLECFKTYFELKLSKSKFFSRAKFLCSDLVVFRPKSQKK